MDTPQIQHHAGSIMETLTADSLFFFALGCLGVLTLWGIKNKIEELGESLQKLGRQNQRVIWKSDTFDFKNLADCKVTRSDRDPLTPLDLDGFECVAVIHTNESDYDDLQIVEIIYARARVVKNSTTA